MFQKIKREKITLIFQVSILITSVILVGIFLRFFLSVQSKNFSEDFSRQSFVELSRGDTFSLARKLSSLSKANYVACVNAKKGDDFFFSEEKGNCSESLFRVRSTVFEENQKIHISITVQLPKEIYYGFLFFILIQSFLAFSFVRSQIALIHQKNELDLNLASLAKQIAHDIRSPMAALNVLATNLQKNSETEVLKKIVMRFQDIISHLPGGNKSTGKLETIERLFDDIISEKKYEYAGSRILNIQFNATSLKHELLLGDSFLWRRTISNLLNNSIEATTAEPVEIKIEVIKIDDQIKISIHDSGKGIPEEDLKKIAQKGVSLGKNGGMGLGLYSTRVFTESLGGKLKIHSRGEGGTTIELFVPDTNSDFNILIEDDLQLADLWLKVAQKKGKKLIHFSSPELFLQKESELPKNANIYLDFEFPNSHLSIEDLGKRLSYDGFKVFLCSGYREKLQEMKWATSILGKEPPWL